MNNSVSNAPIYTERLLPSVNTYIAIAIVWPTVWLTMYPWSHTAGFWIGVAASIALAALAITTAPRIVVEVDSLVVGKASIPRREIATAFELVGEDARRERGPDLSPRAFVVFRGTTQKLVKIELSSEVDPTPYWLISSRRPAAFAQALNS